MPLSDDEVRILQTAGTNDDPTHRRRAVAIYLKTRGDDQAIARRLLAGSYSMAIQPSFHLVPYGDKMLDPRGFLLSYKALAKHTNDFSDVSLETLTEAIMECPAALIPLRIVLSLTRNEFAFTAKLVDPESRVTDAVLHNLEQQREPATADVEPLIRDVVKVALAVMDRIVLTVPPSARAVFHSKLDHRDTLKGWSSVSRSATRGVPYSDLLYQRYVGGAWRQALDTYSEVKGDTVLELPIESWLTQHRIPFYRSPSGATGARQTQVQFGMQPGPDFVIPPQSPSVVIESKVAEDGGTARDKAARISGLAKAARERGFAVCAVVDGKGWLQRMSALVEVVVATEGRTYTLQTLDAMLNVPELAAAVGKA